ncbi:phytoene dehydrogenase-like protein [Microbacterium trichothecenolyticum]|uniref:phytoene desaturase family protein n=1 Tax=Microbacterium trichothecenolyticum TaxID=69370 RepID=UPI002855FB53|nr:NAD(P)/FAD-dependent oxidoreductase [Microbacterium trichothecenolyticum]MDR7183251.1 phytoene dehydrogenase-like protein [Microbacterium trichothecenolyticum]
MVAAARSSRYDVAIVGGGHNALVAAAYLARAGRSVVVLERLDHVGGAAVSERPWAGVDARLSRYSYLVSLLPQGIIDDLGLDIRLLRRRYSSYTPDPAAPSRGILIDTADAAATAGSFARVTGSSGEATRFGAFSDRIEPVARLLFPSMTQPLRRHGEVRAELGDDRLWSDLFERPLGDVIRSSFDTDIARGIALTDGLIGTFASADDESLRQNRCFLYHVIGGGTGHWDVPVGGMGRVTAELSRAATEAGAELRTETEATAVTPDGEITLAGGGVVHARLVLSGVGPAVLSRLLAAGGADAPPADAPAPEGAQLKVNMLLKRLPRLRDGSVAPEAAFAGTFHVNETMTQLDDAYRAAVGGSIPDPLPAEIYCHSLTDPTILGPDLRASGAHTLTLFGLQVPHRLVDGRDTDAARAALLEAARRSLDAVLAEPIADCLYEAPDGTLCVEARTTADLEHSLGMVGGDIFHGPLSWPWAGDDEPLDTPAERWGVATQHPTVLMCGSGARRGGAVSGLGGHNAAMAALELLRH